MKIKQQHTNLYEQRRKPNFIMLKIVYIDGY